MSWKPREITDNERRVGALQHELACNALKFQCAECEDWITFTNSYRCFYCKMYVCQNCAEKHFKKEPQE